MNLVDEFGIGELITFHCWGEDTIGVVCESDHANGLILVCAIYDVRLTRSQNSSKYGTNPQLIGFRDKDGDKVARKIKSTGCFINTALADSLSDPKTTKLVFANAVTAAVTWYLNSLSQPKYAPENINCRSTVVEVDQDAVPVYVEPKLTPQCHDDTIYNGSSILDITKQMIR